MKTLRLIIPLSAITAVVAVLLVSLPSGQAQEIRFADVPGLGQVPLCNPGENLTTEAPQRPWRPGDLACDARHLGEELTDVTIVRPPTPAPPVSPLLHSGYHYTGPVTTYPVVYGIFASRKVVNATLDSGDTLYATMHVCGDYNCSKWGEIGWAEFGSGSRCVFTYSTTFPTVKCYDEYPISPGQTLYMQLSWNGFTGWPYYWFTWLWWNSQWNLLASFTIESPNSLHTDLVYEAISSDSDHLTLPIAQVEGTQIERCWAPPNDCSWTNWTAAAIPSTTVFNDAPYHAHFQSQYYKWYGHSH